MTITLGTCTNLPVSPDLASQWDALMRTSCADIVFDRRWISAWWEAFGGHDRPMLLTFHENNAMIGLLPLVISRPLSGLCPMQTARLMGPLPYFAVHNLPFISGRATECWARLGAEGTSLLSDVIGADILCLSGLSAAGSALASLDAALPFRLPCHVLQREQTNSHALIPLGETYDAYIARLSRKRRVKQRKSAEEIAARGIVTQCLTGKEAADFLDEFVALHNAQWIAQGRQGHFDDWPHNATFFRQVLTAMAEDSLGRFYLQRDSDGRVLSAQFCFVTPPGCMALLTARDLQPETLDLGIGLYAQFERIAAIIPEGVRWIDSGSGVYDHKLSIGAEMQPMFRFLIADDRLSARLRKALLLGVSEAIHLLYYRIWFWKVAPRLRRWSGRKPGPLWRGWIRTRL